jgi:hypothetical protein
MHVYCGQEKLSDIYKKNTGEEKLNDIVILNKDNFIRVKK